MGNVNKWSKTAATNATADPDINWAEGQAPSTVNDSARQVMRAVANDRDDTRGALTTAGTSTSYTLTTNSGNATLQDGLQVGAVIHATNGATPTLNVDGLGTKPIYKAAGGTVGAIASGDMVTDFHGQFQYDASLNGASGAWVLLNPPGGTVTSVQMTVPSFLSVSGGPITASGTFAVTLSGTALPVADGGTGATAYATAAEYRAATANKPLEPGNVWSSADYVSLTDAATVAVDMSTGYNFTVTLAGNRTLGFPTNPKAGQRGTIEVKQDATGSRTLAYAAGYKWAGGTAGVLSTAANAVDEIYYNVRTTGEVRLSLTKGWA